MDIHKFAGLHVLQWLAALEQDGHYYRMSSRLAFLRACKTGRLHVAEWLRRLGCYTYFSPDELFRSVIWEGHLGVAKWLQGVGGVHIHGDDDYAFKISISQGHLEIGRWLMGLDPLWAWPCADVEKLKCWSPARDAWIQAVVRSSFPVGRTYLAADAAMWGHTSWNVL
jgi:hypothetical protein